MKKNYLWSLLAIVMVAMLSVSFISCSSDDDEASIVGTWVCDDDEFLWCFKADGTGYGEEFVYQNGKQISKDLWPITYVYDEKRNVLVIFELPEDGSSGNLYTETYDVVTLTNKQLVLREQGDDDTESFTRK